MNALDQCLPGTLKPVKILLASVAGRAPVEGHAEEYLRRIAPYAPAEIKVYRTESALLDGIERIRTREAPALVLLDSRGKMFTSEAFAAWIGRQRDEGLQRLIFAVGPANGWSEKTLKHARMLLSFGPMTLPHELARIVLAEQVYRAFTLLAGHPYHSGH